MHTKLARTLGIASIAGVVVGVATGFAAQSGLSSRPQMFEVRAKGNSSVDLVKQRFRAYPVYFVGQQFENLPLVAVDRQKGQPRAGEPRGIEPSNSFTGRALFLKV